MTASHVLRVTPGDTIPINAAADFVPGNATVTDKPPSLADMQAMVGGYVEHVHTWTHKDNSMPCQLFVNEDGRMHGMFTNTAATTWFNRQCPDLVLAPLVGPVVVLVGKDVQWD